MVDWKSPAEIAKDALAFDRFMHVLLGLFLWEWFTSLNFDWQFVTGKKAFRWPMTFYFLNRYCLLFSLIGIIVALNVKTEIDCQALYTFNSLFGNATIGLASINLSLRTMAIWSRRWYIVAPLVVIILGHWSLLLHGVVLKAAWIPGQGCAITDTNTTVLVATWIYTMSFDFIVLSLTAVKLAQPNSGFRSKLVVLIFKDGLIYFIIVFLANVVATIFMLLNLNPVMSIIANVPAAIVSTIVACRIVRRLSNFKFMGAEVLQSTTQSSTLAHGSNVKYSSKSGKVGVHVQMETFRNPALEDKTFIDMGYDAPGAMGKSNSYDPECPAIHGEFKRPTY